MTEDLGPCSICKIGHLRPTGEAIIPGESVGEFEDLGTRRVLVCDNDVCKKRQVRVGVHQYVNIDNTVKTTKVPAFQ
jgi:hypothetical protein